MLLGVIDYKVGNVGAVLNMCNRLGIIAQRITSSSSLENCSHAILPGVGSFDSGIEQLNLSGFTEAIKEFVSSGKPLMGICLGAQMLTNGSEEGSLPGLGIINAQCVKFSREYTEKMGFPTPHMGWNSIQFLESGTLCQAGDEEKDYRFYFAHSYHFLPASNAKVLAKTVYGQEFASILRSENIFAVQFHPEKSHKYGMQLIKNFSNL